MTTPELVLASASPRRAQLLAGAGYQFRVAATYADETVAPGTEPTEAAVSLAVRKALAAVAPGAFVVAADTLIDLDGRILGKPADISEAVRTLRALSGRAHWVVTGVAVRRHETVLTGLGQTKVTFRELSDEEIARYVATGEPMDKAGAYAIQGGAREFVARVDGAFDNVAGLPVDVVRRLLLDLGYSA